MQSPQRLLAVSLLALLLFFIAALSSLVDGQVLHAYSHFVSPLTGGILAFLTMYGIRRWMWLAPAVFLYPYLFGYSAPVALLFGACHILAATLTVWVLRDMAQRKYISVSDSWRLLLASLLGGLLSATLRLLAHLATIGNNSDLGLLWIDWCLGDMLGILITVPCWLAVFQVRLDILKRQSLGLLASLLLGTILAGIIYASGDEQTFRFSYFLFPLVIFVAMWLGHVGVSLVIYMVVMMAGFAVTLQPTIELAAEQGFLITLVAVGLFLASSRAQASEAERETQSARFKLQNVLDALPSFIFLEDLQGQFIYANKAFSELSGQDHDYLIGCPVAEVCDALGLPPAVNMDRANVFQWTLHDGEQRRTMLCFQFPLHDEDGAHYGLGFAATDVTDQLAAEEQLRLSSQVFEHASEGILMTDAQARIIAINPAFTRITGFSAEEAIGKVSRIFWAQDHTEERIRDMLSCIEQEGQWQGEMEDRRKNGEYYPAWISISAVRNQAGRITHYVGIFSDFTSRKEAESRLQFLAERDPLTQLYNRSALQDRLTNAINQANAKNGQLLLFFIDLDRFKVINDTLGHAVGDELLQVIALRLRHCLKQGDIIARLGGDEFTVLIDNPPQNSIVADIAERIVNELARPCQVRGHELLVTCSVGMSRYPVDAKDANELMRNADMAMYRAKEMGKNTYQFYAEEINERVAEIGRLEGKLRTALVRNQLILHYQPQYALQGEELVGFEALIRWQHPELGMVPPASFIPVAEESGLIVQIGEWVMRRACEQLVAWRAAGIDVPRMSVNLSASQIGRGKLLQTVQNILTETRLDPSRLELELTESMIMKNADEAVAVLSELRAMGVRVAIDDFGTGYSSLANLRDYPVDCLKIDRHFVQNLPDDDEANAIIEAIVTLARRMQLSVVAEGVETEKQATYLRHIGCEIAQGYFYGRPQAPDFYEGLWQDRVLEPR